jgi:hypothetical protein
MRLLDVDPMRILAGEIEIFDDRERAAALSICLRTSCWIALTSTTSNQPKCFPMSEKR